MHEYTGQHQARAAGCLPVGSHLTGSGWEFTGSTWAHVVRSTPYYVIKRLFPPYDTIWQGLGDALSFCPALPCSARLFSFGIILLLFGSICVRDGLSLFACEAVRRPCLLVNKPGAEGSTDGGSLCKYSVQASAWTKEGGPGFP